MRVEIERLVPKFILQDQTGYAMAKAIEKAFQAAAEAVQNGLDTVLNVDEMPEWRLDEMAWELNCLYDRGADIEKKRYWIKNAAKTFAIYGTKAAVEEFLRGEFTDAEVREWFEYEGEPYHFTVSLTGAEMTAEKLAWATVAIERVKNLRSVLDDVTIDSAGQIVISVAGEGFPVEWEYPRDILYSDGEDIYD